MKDSSYLDEVTFKEILIYAYHLENKNMDTKDFVENIKQQILLAMKNK